MKPDFNSMSIKDLKNYATKNSIDLNGATKKPVIISILEEAEILTAETNGQSIDSNKESEAINMSEELVLTPEELEAAAGTLVQAAEVSKVEADKVAAQTAVTALVDGDVKTALQVRVDAVIIPAEEKAIYHLDDGSECSRSAYIRQEFKKDRDRKSIAKDLGVKYYIVYSATANMFNAVHPEEGGTAGSRGAVVAKVNKDLKFVDENGNVEVDELDADGNVVINAETGLPNKVAITAETAAQVQRAELMRELCTAGLTRSALKDYFEVPYATVYAATKEDNADGTTKSTKVTLIHPETGESIGRADYIRELFATGMDRRDIAKKLTKMTDDLVDYATVWAATKPNKVEVAVALAEKSKLEADKTAAQVLVTALKEKEEDDKAVKIAFQARLDAVEIIIPEAAPVADPVTV